MRLRVFCSNRQVRQIILSALKDDVRYADFKRKFSRNLTMDINLMKAHLLEAARDCNDLVVDLQSALKLSKKAVDLTSSRDSVVDLPLQGGKEGKGGGKGGKG